MEGNAGSKVKENPQSSAPTDQTNNQYTSHLITHFPADVLKIIFEAIPTSPDNTRVNFIQANSLSAVCRAWRIVALDTPKIWSDISLRMDSDHLLWEEYWAHMVERVKKVPVKIRIIDLCIECPNDLSRAIQEASLTIDFLHLIFEHPDDINNLAKIWGGSRIYVKDFTISTSPCARFSDICNVDERRHSGHDFEMLSRSVQCHHTLSFMGRRHNIRFPRTANAPIVQLYLRSLREVDMLEICCLFPAIEVLDFDSCHFKPVVTRTRTPHLRSLRIRAYVPVEWLDTLHFLRLDCFSYNRCSIPQLDQFLARHQTVTTLSISGYAYPRMERGEKTFNSTNQVLFVSLPPGWVGCVTADHAFSSLRSLTIVYPHSTDIEAFDRLVKKRCLPLSHPESEAKSPLLILDEVFLEGDEHEIYWYDITKSHWFIEATKELQRCPEGKVTKVKLTWPIHLDNPS